MNEILINQGLHSVLIMFCCSLIFRVKIDKQGTGEFKGNQYLLYFLIAFLLWVVMDIQRIIFFSISNMSPNQHLQKSLFLNFFSAWNNAFLLGGLLFFQKYLPIPFSKRTNWAKVIFIATALLMIVYIFLWSIDNQNGVKYIRTINSGYSFITFILIGIVFSRTFQKLRSIGVMNVIIWITIFVFLTAVHYLNEFNIFSGLSSNRYLFLYALHLFICVSTMLMIFQFKNYEQIKNLSFKNQLLESKLTQLSSNKSESEVMHLGNASKRHLRFFQQADEFVLELTMLDKGIVKYTIRQQQLSREYKDLLRMAVYKKNGQTVQAYSGMHRGFGEISKAVFDIRKRFINPVLKKSNLPTLENNELIVQRIKGSGIYELDCHLDHIQIDLEGFNQHEELSKIISSLIEKETI